MTQKNTLLIIDDTPTNIEMLAAITGSEYVILSAGSGKEGLDIAMKKRPDLIILDVMMPEMDGYEVCARLKKNLLTVAIPVIFVTALDHFDDVRAGLEAGAIDYIAKPFHPELVKTKIKNYLAYRNLLLQEYHSG